MSNLWSSPDIWMFVPFSNAWYSKLTKHLCTHTLEEHKRSGIEAVQYHHKNKMSEKTCIADSIAHTYLFPLFLDKFLPSILFSSQVSVNMKFTTSCASTWTHYISHKIWHMRCSFLLWFFRNWCKFVLWTNMLVNMVFTELGKMTKVC